MYRKDLLNRITNLKETDISDNTRKIKPFILESLEKLENQSKNFNTSEEKLQFILEICKKYKNPDIKLNENEDFQLTREEMENPDSVLARHKRIIGSIKNRINDSINLIYKDLNLDQIILNKREDQESNSSIKNNEKEYSDDDFLVEEINPNVIIKH